MGEGCCGEGKSCCIDNVEIDVALLPYPEDLEWPPSEICFLPFPPRSLQALVMASIVVANTCT